MAVSRNSSIEAICLPAIRFFIIAVVPAVANGSAATKFGIAMCIPIIGIRIAALPSVPTLRLSSFFKSSSP